MIASNVLFSTQAALWASRRRRATVAQRTCNRFRIATLLGSVLEKTLWLKMHPGLYHGSFLVVSWARVETAPVSYLLPLSIMLE